jgi:hypothetical protein
MLQRDDKCGSPQEGSYVTEATLFIKAGSQQSCGFKDDGYMYALLWPQVTGFQAACINDQFLYY